MDTQGRITGLLDIAKCLYDAINRLEKAARKKEAAGGGAGAASGTSGGEDNAMMLGAMIEAAKVMKGKGSARNQRAFQVCARTGTVSYRTVPTGVLRGLVLEGINVIPLLQRRTVLERPIDVYILSHLSLKYHCSIHTVRFTVSLVFTLFEVSLLTCLLRILLPELLA